MADTSKELAVDLYKLHVVAKDCLPAVAAEYRVARSKVDTSTAVASDAMRRPEFFGGGQNPVHRAWAALAETLGQFLAETETSLDDTARALHLAVSRYAATDSEAAAELDRLLRNHEESRTGQ